MALFAVFETAMRGLGPFAIGAFAAETATAAAGASRLGVPGLCPPDALTYQPAGPLPDPDRQSERAEEPFHGTPSSQAGEAPDRGHAPALERDDSVSLSLFSSKAPDLPSSA